MVHTQSARVRAQHSQMPVDTVAAHAAQQTARGRARTLTNTRPLRAHIAYICAHARVWHRNAKNAISLFIWRLPVVGASTAAQQHRRRCRCRRSRPKNLETRSTYTRTRVRRCRRAVERTRTLACRQTDTDRSAGECPSETGLIGPNRAHEQQHHKHTQKKTCCSNRNKHTHVYGNNDYSITIVNTETHTHTHTFAVSVRARVTFLVGWLAGWGPVRCMSCLSC